MTDTGNGKLAAITCSRAEAEDKFRERIRLGGELLQRTRHVTSDEQLADAKRKFRSWEEYNVTLLRGLFTTAEVAEEYRERGAAGYAGAPLKIKRDTLCRRIDERLRKIESEMEQLRLHDEATPVPEPQSKASASPLEPVPHVSASSASVATKRVFVSSTYEDLADHRSAVIQALTRPDVDVRGMENFGARPDPPKDVCLREVRDSDVYVGIFGTRYGSIDPETGKSMTQLEYEEAIANDLDIRIYVLDVDKQPVLAKYVDAGEPSERLGALKSELRREHYCGCFTTPESLAECVHRDLFPGEEVQRIDMASRPLLEVSGVPGADAETWYTGRYRLNFEQCYWVHCVCRATNRGTGTSSIVRVQVLLDTPAGESVELLLLPLGTPEAFRGDRGGRPIMDPMKVHVGAVWVGHEGQIVLVQPGIPTDLEILAKGGRKRGRGTELVGITVVCTDQLGHEMTWKTLARHYLTTPVPEW